MPWTWVGPGSRPGSTSVQKVSTSSPAGERITTATSTIRSCSGEKPVVSTSTTAKPGGCSPAVSTVPTVDRRCNTVSHARQTTSVTAGGPLRAAPSLSASAPPPTRIGPSPPSGARAPGPDANPIPSTRSAAHRGRGRQVLGVGPLQLAQLLGHVGFVLLLVLTGLGRAPAAVVQEDGRDEQDHAPDADPAPP